MEQPSGQGTSDVYVTNVTGGVPTLMSQSTSVVEFDSQDEGKLYNAIRIKGENPLLQLYLIEWEGTDDKGKPWKDSWERKKDVTPDLPPIWKKWKREQGVPRDCEDIILRIKNGSARFRKNPDQGKIQRPSTSPSKTITSRSGKSTVVPSPPRKSVSRVKTVSVSLSPRKRKRSPSDAAAPSKNSSPRKRRRKEEEEESDDDDEDESHDAEDVKKRRKTARLQNRVVTSSQSQSQSQPQSKTRHPLPLPPPTLPSPPSSEEDAPRPTSAGLSLEQRVIRYMQTTQNPTSDGLQKYFRDNFPSVIGVGSTKAVKARRKKEFGEIIRKVTRLKTNGSLVLAPAYQPLRKVPPKPAEKERPTPPESDAITVPVLIPEPEYEPTPEAEVKDDGASGADTEMVPSSMPEIDFATQPEPAWSQFMLPPRPDDGFGADDTVEPHQPSSPPPQEDTEEGSSDYSSSADDVNPPPPEPEIKEEETNILPSNASSPPAAPLPSSPSPEAVPSSSSPSRGQFSIRMPPRESRFETPRVARSEGRTQDTDELARLSPDARRMLKNWERDVEEIERLKEEKKVEVSPQHVEQEEDHTVPPSKGTSPSLSASPSPPSSPSSRTSPPPRHLTSHTAVDPQVLAAKVLNGRLLASEDDEDDGDFQPPMVSKPKVERAEARARLSALTSLPPPQPPPAPPARQEHEGRVLVPPTQSQTQSVPPRSQSAPAEQKISVKLVRSSSKEPTTLHIPSSSQITNVSSSPVKEKTGNNSSSEIEPFTSPEQARQAGSKRMMSEGAAPEQSSLTIRQQGEMLHEMAMKKRKREWELASSNDDGGEGKGKKVKRTLDQIREEREMERERSGDVVAPVDGPVQSKPGGTSGGGLLAWLNPWKGKERATSTEGEVDVPDVSVPDAVTEEPEPEPEASQPPDPQPASAMEVDTPPSEHPREPSPPVPSLADELTIGSSNAFSKPAVPTDDVGTSFTLEALRDELAALTRSNADLTTQVDLFRSTYQQASSLVTTLTTERNALQEDLSIAKSQATSGVALLRASFESQLSSLEKDRNEWRDQAMLIARMSQRAEEWGLREKAAEYDVLKAKVEKLVKEKRELEGEVLRLAGDVRERERMVESLEGLKGEVEELREKVKENGRVGTGVGFVHPTEVMPPEDVEGVPAAVTQPEDLGVQPGVVSHVCKWRLDGVACAQTFDSADAAEQHWRDVHLV